MCGIVCLFDAKQKTDALRPQILEMSKKIRHRGPDWSGIFQSEKTVFSSRKISNRRPNFWETTSIHQRRKSSSCCEWRNLQPPRTQKRIPRL